MTTRTPDLLDILAHTESYEWPAVPLGLVYGWRSTRPDMRSRDGFLWAFPGAWTDAPDDGRDLTADHPDEACPSSILGGLCLAKTWAGAQSSGVPAMTALLVAYDPADVLGQDTNKLRVRRAVTLDVIDATKLDLSGADLTRANLSGADADQHTRWPVGFDHAAAGVVTV